MPKSNRKICTVCNSVHQAMGDVCSNCKHMAKQKSDLAKDPLCAFCGKEKPLSNARRPYCSFDCARSVIDISVECSRQVKKAIKAGHIAPLDGSVCCVDCGIPADRYDHRDYTKPLIVEPVCRGCNKRRGPAHTMPACGKLKTTQTGKVTANDRFLCNSCHSPRKVS